MNYGMIIGVLLYEVLIIGGIGYWLYQKSVGKEQAEGEFALGGRDLPTPVLAVTLALTVLGAAHILGVFEMTWGMGAAAVWFSIAHVILLVVVCTTTGLWFRRLGLTTVPQVLKTFFSAELELLVSCVMAGVIFGILTLEAQGLGIVISAMTGWSIETLLVMAATNNMKNQRKPKSLPPAIKANTFGNARKPKSNVPCSPAATPRKMNAAGKVIKPPRQTSKNSFMLLDVSPLNTTSSFSRR